jgi:hypothetical protein
VTTQFQLSFSPRGWKLPLRQQFTASTVDNGFH